MDEDIFKIQNYLNNDLFEPSLNWPKDEFKKRCYSRWAVNEIITRIMDRPLDPPDQIIELFLIEMIIYSTRENDSDEIFSIASNTAEELLGLL
jgi:hypothetical protein